MTDHGNSVLVRYGLIRRDQIVAAERLRQREGGTIGECLVRLGITDEEKLVDFYHKRLMVPRLDGTHFQRVPKRALVAVPADMAAEFRVFPVELDSEGTLTLAMADPSDQHIVDEVMFFTDRFCQRAVADSSVIRAAIEYHYGVRFASPAPSAPAAHVSPSEGRVEEEEEPVLLLTQKKADNTPLPEPLPASDTIPPEEASFSLVVTEEEPAQDEPAEPLEDEEPVPLLLTQRKPAPAPVEEPADAPILLDRPRADKRITLTGMPTMKVPDPPLARLRSVITRDEIAKTLLDYIGEMTPRAALFVMRKGALHGYDGRGAVDPEGVRRMVIGVESPSLFRDVIQSRLPYRGPLPETPANTVFSQMVGAIEGDVLLLPISVRDKVICLAYADGVATTLPDAALHAVSREAGMAYERVILESKR